LGGTFNPGGCALNTYLQSVSPGSSYAAPSDGVITSWSHQASGSATGMLRLKLGRPAGGSNFTIVGESEVQPLVPSTLNSFPTRIAVKAGDVLGLRTPNSTNCSVGSAGHVLVQAIGDVPPGTTASYASAGSVRLDVSAILEPDIDNDGYGDETQDCAPTDPSRSEDCAPPETAITTHPKDKTKKKTATFEFTSTEPGSTFECSLDGLPFAACSSPDTLKVKKGRHTFQVRAKDPAGNVDSSPAADDWKVKKKNKKKK